MSLLLIEARSIQEKALDPALGVRFELVKRSASYKVLAKDSGGHEIGYAILGIKGHALKVVDVEVTDPSWRRKGVASGMYAFAEKQTGMKVMASDDQTADGAALWRGNQTHRQFG